jgi:hypothetical protein
MGSVSAKSLEDGSDYKHDPLEGFSNGRKPRGNFKCFIIHCQLPLLTIRLRFTVYIINFF